MTKAGAKTEEGKAVSRLNAVKTGFHVKGLLPWEDTEEVRLERLRLHEQWSGTDPTSQELVNQLHSIQLRIRRIERLEYEYIMTRLHGLAARAELCREAGIDPDRAAEVPDWFFDNSEPGREEARRLLAVHEELVQMEFIDPQGRSPSSRKKYFRATDEMRRTGGAVRVNLERRIRKMTFEEGTVNTPDIFLRCFEQEYVFELFWAKHPARCEALVQGLRAGIALQAQNQESWSRQLGSLLKQQTNLLSMLVMLKQTRTIPIVGS